jgi:hypothetical protein
MRRARFVVDDSIGNLRCARLRDHRGTKGKWEVHLTEKQPGREVLEWVDFSFWGAFAIIAPALWPLSKKDRSSRAVLIPRALRDFRETSLCSSACSASLRLSGGKEAITAERPYSSNDGQIIRGSSRFLCVNLSVLSVAVAAYLHPLNRRDAEHAEAAQ